MQSFRLIQRLSLWEETIEIKMQIQQYGGYNIWSPGRCYSLKGLMGLSLQRKCLFLVSMVEEWCNGTGKGPTASKRLSRGQEMAEKNGEYLAAREGD